MAPGSIGYVAVCMEMRGAPGPRYTPTYFSIGGHAAYICRCSVLHKLQLFFIVLFTALLARAMVQPCARRICNCVRTCAGRPGAGRAAGRGP